MWYCSPHRKLESWVIDYCIFWWIGNNSHFKNFIIYFIDVFNKDDITPLMIAAKSGHADNLFNLLQNGANPNLSNQKKRSAMHFVAIGGDVR